MRRSAAAFAVIADNFTESIASHCRNFLTINKNSKAVTLVFQNLAIREVIYTKDFEYGTRIPEKTENAHVEMDVMFLELDSTRQNYKILYESSVNLRQGGQDVTKGHGKRIVDALFRTLNEFNSAEWQQSNFLPVKDLMKFDNEKNILTCSEINKGIYKTFNEFRTNSPEEFEFSQTIEYVEDGHAADILNNAKSQSKYDYGFFNGEDLFINRHNYQIFTGPKRKTYIKALEIGKIILLEDMISDAKLRADLSNPAILGELGAVVGYGFYKAYEGDSKGNGIILHAETGDYFSLTNQLLEKIIENDRELLYKYKNAREKNFNINRAFIKSYNERQANRIK